MDIQMTINDLPIKTSIRMQMPIDVNLLKLPKQLSLNNIIMDRV